MAFFSLIFNISRLRGKGRRGEGEGGSGGEGKWGVGIKQKDGRARLLKALRTEETGFRDGYLLC